MLFGHRGRERQRFQLFNSSAFGENDLLFKDVTNKLSVLPDDMDVSQVLGLDYVALLKGLGHEGASLSLFILKTLTLCDWVWRHHTCVQAAHCRTVWCDGAASATQSRRSVSSGLSASNQTLWCVSEPFQCETVSRRLRWVLYIAQYQYFIKLCRKATVPFLQRDEVDAASLDATHSFIAGKCGLTPVVTEYYGKTPHFELRLIILLCIHIIKLLKLVL